MTTFYFFGEVWSWQLYYVWFVQVWALPLPIWVVPPSLSPRQGRLCRMKDKIIRKFIQANNKTTRDFVVQKMTPELKELIRTWGLSESVEEEKISYIILKSTKAQVQTGSAVVRWGLGSKDGLLGLSWIPQVSHLTSFTRCTSENLQNNAPVCVFFYQTEFQLALQWIPSEGYNCDQWQVRFQVLKEFPHPSST